MLVSDINAIAPTVSDRPVEFHDCTLIADELCVVWTWGDCLHDSRFAPSATVHDVVDSVLIALTPEPVLVRCEDGSVIAPDGSVVDV